MKRENKTVVNYWLKFYLNNNHCGLCGNTGVIDTVGRAVTPAGLHVGMKAFCICPNGQALRAKGTP